MKLRLAGSNDIDILVKLREDFLADGNKVISESEKKLLNENLYAYFMKYVSDGSFIAVIAEENSEILSTAFMTIDQKPPRSSSSTFLSGTVYNVYTYPQHRRKGIATKVMNVIIEEAKKLGLSSVDLLASEEGKEVITAVGLITVD